MKMVPFYKLFSFADGIDIILMTLGTIGAIANGLSRPFTVFLLGELIDDFRVSSHTTHDATSVSHASQVPLKFVYLALGCGVGAFLQVSCWIIAGERQAARVGSFYLKNILRQEIAYFDQHISSGEAIGRMTVDRLHFQDAIGENVGKFVEVIAGAVGGFVIAFLKGWLLTLALLSTCSLIFIFGKIMHIFRRKIALQSQLAHDAAANLVQQTIGSMRTVASLTGEKHAMDGYNELLNSSYKFDLRLTLNSALEHGLHSFISICTISFGIWFGARMILHNAYTPGEVFTIIIVIVQISGPISLRQAYPAMVAFTVGQVAAFKMFEVINRKPKIDAYDANGQKLNDSIRGDIMLKEVFFSYPSRPKELILNGFSLFIPSGTTAALVGHSGSGKSTVISLIERFYDPQSGEILVDGIDVREFQLKWIRSQIGLVSQEPALFTDTIRENIAYGRLNGATLEEIKVAAELAHANDFINELPQGLDTIVGENGIQLSGGQKQRIAIARAILKDPRVLLLDEATSALDTNSERILQEALEKIMVNKTTVIVAHRLSTIRNAHTIAVLHQGKIVEKGTHLELLKDSKGVYSTLVSSQQLKEVVEQSLEYDSDITAAKFGTKSSPSLTTSSPLHHASLDSYEKETAANVSEPSMCNHDKTVSLNASREGSAQEGSVFQLAHLNKPEFPILIAGAIFSMITGATPLVYAFLISNVIKTFYEVPHKLEKDSQFWALMFLIDALASGISHPLKAYLFGVAGNKLIKRIRLKCFEKVINMEIGWFDEPQNSSAAIGARLSNDVAKVRVVVGDSLANFAYITSSIVLGMTLAFEASWQLSFVVLALIPAIGLNIYVQMKSMKGFSSDAKVKYEEACQVANDGISHIRTVSSFCAQDMIKEMHDMKCHALMKNEAKHGVICGVGFCISICFLHSVYAIILYAGAKFVQHRKLTASDIFRVFYALSMMSTAIYTSSSFALDTRKAKSAVASIFGMLGKESKIDPGDESGIILQNVKGEIEVKHVNFSYPTRPSVQILRDFSLTIHSGQVVALVGESGSGKSTVISLLERFYDPDSGHITVDGIDISKFQVKWLRQQIGLVSQEPILLNNTIRANIASGKGDGRATEAEIIAAARLANAHEFITCLQEGYDTTVGERGVQLSGGQKQRIAIARAIVKNPKILLLDEATSALDVDSEKTVQEALDKVMASKSAIVVAHRLSTIKGADVIAVVKNGSIMEKGNHNTLVDMKDGLYSSLVRSFHM